MGDKVVSVTAMVQEARRRREEGKTVVFTNGCFDLLHMGHVRYLAAAKRLGSVLFVGVNSDDSTHRLKGRDRPFNKALDRAGVIAALEPVDLVAIFGQDTAAELVAEVRPAVYVKGGDYDEDPASPKFPIEGHTVTRYRGVVRILPLAPGYSTTGLIDRIRSTRSS